MSTELEYPPANADASPPDPTSFGQWAGLYVTGGLVVTFVIGHLWAVHYAGQISTDGYTYATVRARLQHPFYRSFDLTLLALALVHGLIGLRRIVADLGICGPFALRVVSLVLLACGLVGLVYGWLIVRAFVG